MQVSVVGTHELFPAKPGASVLQVLGAAHGRLITSGCHGGGCGVCRIQITRGDYATGRMSRAHVSEQDEAEGIALACQVWPQGDLTVLPLGRRLRLASATTNLRARETAETAGKTTWE